MGSIDHHCWIDQIAFDLAAENNPAATSHSVLELSFDIGNCSWTGHRPHLSGWIFWVPHLDRAA